MEFVRKTPLLNARFEVCCSATGLRFRLHTRELPGSPDLVFPRYRAAVFVHGCFWHQHPGCRFATTPASNAAFWQAKFEANVARDACALRSLQAQGWRTGVVWECELRADNAAIRAGEIAL